MHSGFGTQQHAFFVNRSKFFEKALKKFVSFGEALGFREKIEHELPAIRFWNVFESTNSIEQPWFCTPVPPVQR